MGKFQKVTLGLKELLDRHKEPLSPITFQDKSFVPLIYTNQYLSRGSKWFV